MAFSVWLTNHRADKNEEAENNHISFCFFVCCCFELIPIVCSQSFSTLMTLSAFVHLLIRSTRALSNNTAKKWSKTMIITHNHCVWVCMDLSILYIERAFVYRCASTSLAVPLGAFASCGLQIWGKVKEKKLECIGSFAH